MTSSRDEELIELADRIVHVARKLNVRMQQDPQIITLTPLEAHAMRHIDHHPGITSSRLAADLELRTSNASTVLRSLVEKNLLQRENSTEDRRVVRYVLTDTAAETIRRLHEHWVAGLGSAIPDSVDPGAALEILRLLEDALE